jgi:hypothetical protein
MAFTMSNGGTAEEILLAKDMQEKEHKDEIVRERTATQSQA